jgi:hypothetical protein
MPSGARAHRPPDRLAARTRIAAPLLALVVGLLPGRFAARPASSEGVLPPQREQQRGEEYETGGAATLEKPGDRFVLIVRRDGVHQIYAQVFLACRSNPSWEDQCAPATVTWRR